MKTLQIIVLILGFAIYANAQKSVLGGTIYDAVGAVIPGAKVIAINTKGERFVAETNDEGVYLLNLPYKDFNSTNIPINEKIVKYEIIVDLEERGFEKRIIKEFSFVPVYLGKMILDIALDSMNAEPCGYGGNGCLQNKTIKSEETIISNKVLQRPLVKLPKAKTNKRKNKNNKQ
ncbi:MAG: hypothetical protein JWN60_1506 [Acidobacteria bacterium]|nr:hypothetical protein [Acidobacteriota bacterium]